VSKRVALLPEDDGKRYYLLDPLIQHRYSKFLANRGLPLRLGYDGRL